LVTIEDPIEYVFEPKKCIVSQREIWHDTWSFPNALRSAMRQDPDILFVWEIRDQGTAEAVLNLAETGHLVFSTLHTNSASHTINRFVSFFSPDIQWSIANRLSESLIWIQSQVLAKSKDWSTRVWIFELLINTPSIKINIKKNDINQIDSIIESSNLIWMISLKQYAENLINKWIIDPKEVYWIINKSNKLEV
jgi:twitching motility protein PilT